MLFFGVCFFLYFIKLSAGKGFWTDCSRFTVPEVIYSHWSVTIAFCFFYTVIDLNEFL